MPADRSTGGNGNFPKNSLSFLNDYLAAITAYGPDRPTSKLRATFSKIRAGFSTRPMAGKTGGLRAALKNRNIWTVQIATSKTVLIAICNCPSTENKRGRRINPEIRNNPGELRQAVAPKRFEKIEGAPPASGGMFPNRLCATD